MAMNGPRGGRRPRKPVPQIEPGEMCTITRTSKAYDDAVTATRNDVWGGEGQRYGVRDCSRCGAKRVPVTQVEVRAVPGSWRYARHRAPMAP